MGSNTGYDVHISVHFGSFNVAEDMPNDRLNGCSGWGAPQDVTKLSKSLHANKQATPCSE